MSKNVMPAYTIQRILAESDNRGVNLSGTGLGTSALYNWMPPTPRNGRMARERTIMPMPPSHWIRLRQNKRLGAAPSMLVITDEPVVVNPDTDSKKASVYVEKSGARKKGRAPKIPTPSHPNATTAMPSRWLM